MRVALALIALVPLLARAAPTGLNQIPTTDLVPDGQVVTQLQNQNTMVRGDASVFHQPTLTPQNQVGLPWRCEAGLDVAASDPPHAYRPVANVKWRAIDEDYRLPAVALGLAGIGVDFKPSAYLVMSKTLNYDAIQYQKFRAHHRNIKLHGIRLHAGVAESGNVWRALLGADAELSDHFVLDADWISGARNSVSLGAVLVFGAHDSIQAALLRENDEPRLTGVIFAITHTFDLAHPLEW